MLAVERRLRRRDEFAAAIRGGRRARRGAVVVHLRTDGQDAGPESGVDPGRDPRSGEARGRAVSPSRAGFVVPKAVGSAVVRNKVRRRLRHLVRDRLASLPAGSLLVVRAQPGAADRPYRRLAADLDAALAAALAAVRPVVAR